MPLRGRAGGRADPIPGGGLTPVAVGGTAVWVAGPWRRRLGVMVERRRRRRTLDKNEAVVRELRTEHGPAVVAYATKLTGDPAAAEDVLQETLIRAWRRSSVLDERRGSIRAWMFTVAHRIVVDRARARSSRPVEVAEHPAAEPRTADHADRGGGPGDRDGGCGHPARRAAQGDRAAVLPGADGHGDRSRTGHPVGDGEVAQPSCAPRAASDVRGSPSGTARRALVRAVRRAGTHMHVDHASPVLVEPA